VPPHTPSPEGEGFDIRLKSTEGLRELMQASLADLELVVVPVLDILMLDVLGNHLIRHVARGRHEEAPCPKMSAPELLAQCPEVLQQVVQRLSAQRLSSEQLQL
jgi:hypothetical protein